MRRMKALIVKHENRIRALEAAMAAVTPPAVEPISPCNDNDEVDHHKNNDTRPASDEV